jgi:hypothetical protein
MRAVVSVIVPETMSDENNLTIRIISKNFGFPVYGFVFLYIIKMGFSKRKIWKTIPMR